MEFPYQKESSRLFGEIYRPVVEFEIETQLGWTRILAYLDSGADITLLPMSLNTLKFVSGRTKQPNFLIDMLVNTADYRD